ncbi:MAG: hypothetical protein NT062_30945 [Proteobacteria bacterium]|nr:hypothetical protein [Pseudomonadota bacterium]
MSDYRLRPVRDVRDRDERSRRGELAAATHDARATQDAVERARAKITELTRAIDATRARALGSTPDGLIMRERYLARRRAELAAAQVTLARVVAAHEQRTTVVDSARVQLAHARAAKEVIERHFATWRDTQRKLAERREE